MSIRKDEAQLIITIDAKESAEYQKSVQRSLELTRNIKKMEVGTDEYNQALKEQAEITKRLGAVDFSKLSIKNLRDRRRALQDQINILPQVTAQELGLERELQRVNQALAENTARTRATAAQLNTLDSSLSTIAPGLSGMVGGLKASAVAARALFATPIGWILAVAAAIGAAAKGWFDYNKSILETRKLTENITGQTGEIGQKIRSQAIAISDVTKATIEDTLTASKVAVNNFGGEYSAALDVIGKGLIQAGSSQNEFLESITEYGVFFSQAGFSFEEFAGIVNTGIDLGIYTDKLPDAIKEFKLSIDEQTKGSRDALENAFGAQFTNKLLKGVKDGSITAAQALSQVSKEADRIGLNAQQAQQLTADLFRGAGEDAGGALNVFKAVNQALSEEPKLLTDIQKAQQESIRLNYELEQSKAAALETDSFVVFAQTFRNLWINIQIGWYNFVEGLTTGFNNFVDKLRISIAGARADFNSLPEVLRIMRDRFFEAFKDIGTAALELTKTLGNLVTFDFAAAEKSFDRFKSSIKSAGTNFKAGAKDANDFGIQARKAAEESARSQIAAERKIAVEQDKIRKEAANKKTPGTNTFGNAAEKEEQKKEAEKRKKEAEKAASEQRKQVEQAFKDRIELNKKLTAALLVEEEARYLKGEISEAEFEENKLKIKSGAIVAQMALLRSLGLQETALYQEKEVELLRLQNETKVKQSAADKSALDQKLNDIKSATDREILEIDKLELNKDLTVQQAEDRRKEILLKSYEDRLQILRDAGQAWTDEYINIENAITEIQKEKSKEREQLIKDVINTGVDFAQSITDGVFDLEQQKNENQKNERIASLEEEYAKKLELAEGNSVQEEAIRKSLERKKRAIEKEAFEKNKQTQISQATTNAALAIIQSLANTTIPFPGSLIAPVLIGIQTAFQVAKIKAQKFNKSGRVLPNLIGSQRISSMPNIPTQEGGDNVLAMVKPNEVILNEQHQARAGGPAFFRALGVPGFNTGGVISPRPIRLPNTSPSGFAGTIAPQSGVPQSDPALMALADSVRALVGVMPEAFSNIQANVNYFDVQQKGSDLATIQRLASY